MKKDKKIRRIFFSAAAYFGRWTTVESESGGQTKECESEQTSELARAKSKKKTAMSRYYLGCTFSSPLASLSIMQQQQKQNKKKKSSRKLLSLKKKEVWCASVYSNI